MPDFPIRSPGDALAQPAVKDAIRRDIIAINQRRVRYALSKEQTYNWDDPEEWVRATTVAWLIVEKGYPANRVKLEMVVPRRTPSDFADIVVYEDDSCRIPYLVVGGTSRACLGAARFADRGTVDLPCQDRTADCLWDIAQAWRDGLTPDPLLTVSEWAQQHRVLTSRASAEPGRYRIARTPYMRDILDALSPADPCRRVVFMKAAQVGATEGGNNWIGYVIHQAPGPMLAVQPTVELAKRNSRQRIDPLIDESAALRERVRPARSRDSGNTMLSKEFPGGILIMTGANSAVGLRSIPARYILLDEVDAYPASADEEGDPVTLAEARSLTFAHRRKVLLISTPTVKGFSRIEREYEASDQRRYFVPCPHCGHRQWLEFERLRWKKGKPETAVYHCKSCDEPIAEHHKTAMLAAGVWRATAEADDPATIGFHLSALYSPPGWKSWADIARDKEAAKGSDEAERAFRNTVLGETWVETGEAPDWQVLYDRRERWAPGTVLKGGLFLTAGADVQKDRIEVDVWAWGRGLESWLIEHIVIEGGPERAEPWTALDQLLSQTWSHENGVALALAKLATYKLLIVDELGFVPLSKTGAELLFEVFSQRYERGATLVTTNLPFDEWTEVFGSERLTGALLDRLTHHVHILEMNGDSYRLNQSRRRQTPTAN